jgi:hypothetical protein
MCLYLWVNHSGDCRGHIELFERDCCIQPLLEECDQSGLMLVSEQLGRRPFPVMIKYKSRLRSNGGKRRWIIFAIFQRKFIEFDVPCAVFMTNEGMTVAVTIPAPQSFNRVPNDGDCLMILTASLFKHGQ